MISVGVLKISMILKKKKISIVQEEVSKAWWWMVDLKTLNCLEAEFWRAGEESERWWCALGAVQEAVVSERRMS